MAIFGERRCALCGQPQSQAKGGLGAFRQKLNFFSMQDVKFKLPKSEYAHISCINKTQAKLNPMAKLLFGATFHARNKS